MTQLIDELLAAAEDTATPTRLKLLLDEAALCIMRLETRDLYDQKRWEFLEDLGVFTLDKKDGEDPKLTIQTDAQNYFCACAATLRETVDLAVEELYGADCRRPAVTVGPVTAVN
ncbi:hypothetical protein [Neisseria musculi]|uniref:Uncharacterized protein n=1 Tax=Neisseria musculi TaxID=1815583 RepID=A0A7H1M7V2_9NEIS|nr:hypothetical protein [Neisseria musculi]QNT57717.1 hypothetical protein H7A79_0340 [Neisseria musculi]